MDPLWTATRTDHHGAVGGASPITLPVEAAAGDQVVVAVAVSSTAPSDPGWQLLLSSDATPTPSAGRMLAWLHQLTAGDITAGTLTLTWTTAGRVAAIASGWPSDVLVADVATEFAFSPANGTSVFTPVADAPDSATVLHLHGVIDDQTTPVTWTPDVATTEVVQVSFTTGTTSRGGQLLIAREDQLAAGPTTSRTATADQTVQRQSATIVLAADTGDRSVSDTAGITDQVVAALITSHIILTEQVGLTDTPGDFELDVETSDTEPVGLTDTLVAHLILPSSPGIRVGAVTGPARSSTPTPTGPAASRAVTGPEV